MGELAEVKDRTPNAALVLMLRDLLENALSGDLRSMVAITVRDDNATGHRWSLDARTWRQPVLAEILYTQSEFMLGLSMDSDAGVLRELRD